VHKCVTSSILLYYKTTDGGERYHSWIRIIPLKTSMAATTRQYCTTFTLIMIFHTLGVEIMHSHSSSSNRDSKSFWGHALAHNEHEIRDNRRERASINTITRVLRVHASRLTRNVEIPSCSTPRSTTLQCLGLTWNYD
jgi:hypothetical protein